jgi:predicted metal-dependent enzyme (double-stranded beta helix superfamily)
MSHDMNEPKTISPDVGTRLLFENDRVRVWDLRLEPGEATGLHRHETDFLYIVIGDGELQTVFADGSSDSPRPMRDGDVRFREVNGESVHDARNTGQSPWRNIVVELKDPRP